MQFLELTDQAGVGKGDGDLIGDLAGLLLVLDVPGVVRGVAQGDYSGDFSFEQNRHDQETAHATSKKRVQVLRIFGVAFERLADWMRGEESLLFVRDFGIGNL